MQTLQQIITTLTVSKTKTLSALVMLSVFIGFLYFSLFNSNQKLNNNLANINTIQTNQNENTIIPTFTDENIGESVIIKSDQENYSGDSGIVSYFSVQNIGQNNEDFDIQFYFPKNIDVGVAMVEMKTENGWKKLDLVSNNPPNPPYIKGGVQRKPIPSEFGVTDSFNTLINFGETKYFRAKIVFEENAQGEFWIEAIGDKGGYGLLDPTFSHINIRGGGGANLAVKIRGGAPSYPYTPPVVGEVFYSVGQSTATNLMTGSPSVTIASGIGTFSIAQTGNIGVGDKITYNTSVIAYISGKISTSQWRLIDAVGQPAPNITDSAVVSITRAYASLFAAEAGATDATHLNTTDLTSGGGFILNIPLYYDTGADTTAVTINGYTTGPSNYIRIYTPYDTVNEVNQSQRHDGKWSNNKWRLILTTLYGIENYEGYVRLEGLQIKTTYTATAAVARGIFSRWYSGTGDTRVSHSIIESSGAGGAALGMYGIEHWGSGSVFNNIIYNATYANSVGIFLEANVGSLLAYNNTVYNCDTGIRRNAGTVVAINNIVVGCGNTNAYVGTFSNSDYNATDGTDTTDGGANSLQSVVDFDFVSETPGSEDFHLGPNSDVIDMGLGTTPKALFTDDIDGYTRPGTDADWDIGADEYGTVLPGIKFR